MDGPISVIHCKSPPQVLWNRNQNCFIDQIIFRRLIIHLLLNFNRGVHLFQFLLFVRIHPSVLSSQLVFFSLFVAVLWCWVITVFVVLMSLIRWMKEHDLFYMKWWYVSTLYLLYFGLTFRTVNKFNLLSRWKAVIG